MKAPQIEIKDKYGEYKGIYNILHISFEPVNKEIYCVKVDFMRTNEQLLFMTNDDNYTGIFTNPQGNLIGKIL